MVNAGSGGFGPVRQGQGAVTTLTADDAEAIRAQVPGIRYLSPTLNTRTQIVAETSNWNTQVQGASESCRRSARGRCSSAASSPRRTCERARRWPCSARSTRDQLFGAGADPVGATVRINNQPFRVVGVLTSKGRQRWARTRTTRSIVPFTTVQQKLLGVQHISGITHLGRRRRAARRDVAADTALLRARHDLPTARTTTSWCARRRR